VKPALLGFALDVLAIAAVALLGLARVLPPEAVIGFFCTVWAAGRGGGPPAPPARPELAPRAGVRTAIRTSLIARALLTLHHGARHAIARLTRFPLPA
jgi:hypothetical protein